MKNNIIQIKDLECPSVELKCALDKLFAKYLSDGLKISLFTNTTSVVTSDLVTLTVLVENKSQKSESNILVDFPFDTANFNFDSKSSNNYNELTGKWTIPVLAPGASTILQLILVADNTSASSIIFTAALTGLNKSASVVVNTDLGGTT